MSEGGFSYVSGSRIAVVVWPVCVLIDVDAADERVGAVYAALCGNGGVDAALDQLAAAGLSRMPAFGLVQVDGAHTRVLVRGPMRATTDDGTVIASTGLFTDQTVDAAGVSLDGGERVGTGVCWPIRDGIVAAEWVGIIVEEEAAAAVRALRAEPAPQADAAPQAEAAPQAQTAPQAAQPMPEAAVPEPAGDRAEPDVEAEPPAVEAPPADAPEAEGAPQPDDDAADSGPLQPVTLSTSLVCLDDLLQDESESVERSGSFIDAFDWRSQADAEPEASPAGGAPSISELTTLPIPGQAETLVDDPSDDWVVPVAPGQASHEAGAEIVAAVRCPSGHLNPPFASVCRVCRAQIDAQEPVQVPRPVLGVLRLSNGAVLTLDRGVILGRNPHALPGAKGVPPNLVRIDDPGKDVSSQHLEVRLEGWFVTVRDLNSTNGTEVTLPGRPTVALRANEPMTIESGTRVQLASSLEFVFEASD